VLATALVLRLQVGTRRSAAGGLRARHAAPRGSFAEIAPCPRIERLFGEQRLERLFGEQRLERDHFDARFRAPLRAGQQRRITRS
jgi:hypothetical protein